MKHNVEVGIILFFGALYTYFLAPGITWLDSGELIAASQNLGFSHPPTHPLHSLVGAFFAHLLPGNIAYRYNALSLVFAVATLVVVFKLIKLTLQREPVPCQEGAALVCVGVLGLTPLFYLQAIRAEIYSLSFLLNSLLLYHCALPNCRRRAEKIAWLAGLSLSTHYLPLALITPAAFLLFQRLPAPRPWNLNTITRIIAWFGAGLLPFAYQIVRELQNPYFALGRFDSPRAIVKTLSGFTDATGHIGQADLMAASLNWVRQWQIVDAQVTSVILLAALVGLVFLLRRQHRTALAMVSLILLPGALMSYVVMSEFSHGNVENPDYGGFLYYPLLAVTVAAALGIAKFLELSRLTNRTFLLRLAAGFLLVGQLPYVLQYGHLRNCVSAQRYVDYLTEILPPESLVVVNGDDLAGPLSYAQIVEGRRRDITLLLRLQLSNPGAYARFRLHRPKTLPELTTLAGLPQNEPSLFIGATATGARAFIERLLQFNRDKPTYWHPGSIKDLRPQRFVVQGGLLKVLHPGGGSDFGNPEPTELFEIFNHPNSRYEKFVFENQIQSPLHNVALFYGEQRNWPQALRWTEHLLRLHPKNLMLHDNLEYFRRQIEKDAR